MNTTTINPKTRRLGWGWSCTPTGRTAYEIETPTHPYYTGTYRQIMAAIAEDRTYQSMLSGGTYTNTAWFYLGRRITAIWGLYNTTNDNGEELPMSEWKLGWIRGDLDSTYEDMLRDGLRIKTE